MRAISAAQKPDLSSVFEKEAAWWSKNAIFTYWENSLPQKLISAWTGGSRRKSWSKIVDHRVTMKHSAGKPHWVWPPTPNHDPLRPWYPRYKYTKDTALKPLNGCLKVTERTCARPASPVLGVRTQAFLAALWFLINHYNQKPNKNRAKETCKHLTNRCGYGDYTEENLKIAAGNTNKSISHGKMLK